ncbi:MAG: methyltransferase FkbM [Acidobacteria bacterium]|nr:MAG: methyltransferase FkbM [Acidobacteriota bacterium]
MKKLKYTASKILCFLCCWLLNSLKGGKSPNMDREELRAVRLSFSQFGEDLIIADLAQMLDLRERTYVDVGAFDPLASSNTLLLHKQGWRGVNVDLDQEKIVKFNQKRPEDQNFCACVSDKPSSVMVARYGRTQTNRVVQDLSEKSLCEELPVSVEKDVRTTTLTSLLDGSRLANRPIGFLNIDCEGGDLRVLQGLDFSRYSPTIIATEAHNQSEEADLAAFLESNGYTLYSKVYITLIFTVRMPTVADRVPELRSRNQVS